MNPKCWIEKSLQIKQIKTEQKERSPTLKRRPTDDQLVCDKGLSIINRQENAKQTTVSCNLTPVRVAVTTKTEDSQC